MDERKYQAMVVCVDCSDGKEEGRKGRDGRERGCKGEAGREGFSITGTRSKREKIVEMESVECCAWVESGRDKVADTDSNTSVGGGTVSFYLQRSVVSSLSSDAT